MDKRKGKELAVGPSKRFKKEVGDTSSAFLPSLGANAELWKLEFSIAELSKLVKVADSAKDHDTSLALVRAGILSKDVADSWNSAHS